MCVSEELETEPSNVFLETGEKYTKDFLRSTTVGTLYFVFLGY